MVLILEEETRKVTEEIRWERAEQDQKWGRQNHPDGTGPTVRVLEDTPWSLDLRTGSELSDIFRSKCQKNTPETDNWRDILLEEVFEAMAEDDQDRLRKELMQVAAVAVAWVECIDRRKKDR